jgi:uncharacterized protein with FMN-binding domain
MRLFTNILTAWISVALMILVIAIWALRILVKKKMIVKGSFLFNANRKLRIYHKHIGIAFLAVSLVHGLLSSEKLISSNWGSITFLAMVIMSASYFVKSRMARQLWADIHRLITVAVIALTVIHLLDVGIAVHLLIRNEIISSQTSAQNIKLGVMENAPDDQNFELVMPSQNEQADTADGLVYADGVYQGVADAYGPALAVEVTVADGKINDVEIISHNEVGERFYTMPMQYLPAEIVERQTPNVDSIAGATLTSIGIKNAVIDALSKAVQSGELPQQKELIETHDGGGGRGNGGGNR